METTETVNIKGEDGKPLRINASDYRKHKHGSRLADDGSEMADDDETVGEHQSAPALTPTPFNPGAPSQTTIPATAPSPSSPFTEGFPGVKPASAAPLPPVAAVTDTVVNPVPGEPLPTVAAPAGEPVAPFGTPAPLAPIPAPLDGAGQPVAPLPPAGEDAALLAGNDAAAPYAGQIGDKWFILDRDGNKVMEKAFASQAAAEKAIKA